MCHYDGQIRKIEQNLPHLLSGWFLTKLWTKTWYLFMGCVTTRLQMEIGMFFLSLTLKNARKLRKLAKFSLEVREPRKNLGKMTKKGRQKFINFPKKMYTFFGGPRTEKKFVKWSASRKRLRTAVLE